MNAPTHRRTDARIFLPVRISCEAHCNTGSENATVLIIARGIPPDTTDCMRGHGIVFNFQII